MAHAARWWCCSPHCSSICLVRLCVCLLFCVLRVAAGARRLPPCPRCRSLAARCRGSSRWARVSVCSGFSKRECGCCAAPGSAAVGIAGCSPRHHHLGHNHLGHRQPPRPRPLDPPPMGNCGAPVLVPHRGHREACRPYELPARLSGRCGPARARTHPSDAWPATDMRSRTPPLTVPPPNMMPAPLERPGIAENAAARKLPRSRSPHIPKNDPRRNRRAPKVSNNLSKVAPESSESWSGSQASAQVDQHWFISSGCWPILANFGQLLAKFGSDQLVLATFLSKLVKVWPTSANNWRVSRNSGRGWPKFGQCCPRSAEL